MMAGAEKDFESYRIGSDLEYSEQQCREIVKLVQQQTGSNLEVLGGRANIQFAEITGIGPVAIKHYARGGLLGRFIAHHYLRVGASRSQREFQLLNMASELEIRVPEPIAYVYTRGLAYRAWLITRRIMNYRSLASIDCESDQQFPAIMNELATQVEKLIQNKIFHIDLHPGNVLIDSSEAVFLIDFDKAYIFRGSATQLRDKYLCRWRRAVLKHGLSDSLSEYFCSGLRKHYEG